MKRFLAALFSFVLICAYIPTPAQAQFVTPALLKGRFVAPPSYTGSGDIVAAQGYWSLRPYNSTVATALGALFNMCDNALLNCHDVHATASGGRNATDMAFNSCNTSGACQIKILYEQTGSGQPNLTLCTTSGGCPLFLPNGVSSGVPAAGPNGGTPAPTGSITSISPPFSMAVALSVPTPNAGFNNRILVAPDPTGLLCCNAGHWSFLSSSLISATATITANTFYSVLAGTDGTGSGAFICQNTSCDTGQNAGSAAFSGTLGTFMQNPATFLEFAIYNVSLNGTQRGNLDTNIRGYWGI